MHRLNKNEIEHLSGLLLNEQNENIAVGIEIAGQHPECIEYVQRELVLLAQLGIDAELSQCAYEILKKSYTAQQLLQWDKEFELFNIIHELYCKDSFEEYWYSFVEHEKVRENYTELIIKNIHYVTGYFTIADCINEYYRSKLDWAERYYLIALMKKPDDLNLLSTLGHFYYEDYIAPEKALKMFDKMLETAPGHIEALQAKAFLYSEYYNDVDKGLDILKEAYNTFKSEQLIIPLAVMMMNHNDSDIYREGKKRMELINAENRFNKKGQTVCTENYYGQTIYAEKLWQTEKDTEAAIKAFHAILEFNKKDFNSLAYLGQIYITVYNNKDKANEYFREAFSIYMDDPHHLVNYIAFLCNHMTDFEAAKSYYNYLIDYCFKDIDKYNLWKFYNISTEEKEKFKLAETILLTKKS